MIGRWYIKFSYPDSRLPTPYSRLPTPDSLLPTPYSLLRVILTSYPRKTQTSYCY
ncbi:hypothetical protein [Moorena sp. SIO4G3]|uniref:hypothetical protein n=1 Tax=Moorena sp. SIO4G3 TaxID=2607821 RepID=UPI00142A3DFC|nr:hypothetical protein [Moorena sp. SIO4G3]NEO81969.1 hypothetical protein [Moorena sp. SIO4G3]